MDLPPQNNGKTQPFVDDSVTSNLHHDNRNVRTLDDDEDMEIRYMAKPSLDIKSPVENTTHHDITKKVRKSQVRVVEDMIVDPKICVPPEIKGRASDMDLPPQNNGKTQPFVDDSVTSNLHHDNRNVRTLDDDEDMEIRYMAKPSLDIKSPVENTTHHDITKKVRKSQVRVVEDMIVDPKICVPPEIKGHVWQGNPQSLLCLLDEYSTYPTELPIGCHGILITENNQPTKLGKYEECEWPSEGYQFVKDLGSGSYGCVKLYRDNTTNVYFVKKIFERDAVSLFEVKFLSELNHENIVKLYGFILRDNTPEILMEYAGVSLAEYATIHDVSEDKIIEMTYQGLSGLEYLDSKGIIHYDIKPFWRKILTEFPLQWAQDSSNAGPIRYGSRNRRRRKDQSSLSYGSHQKMDTSD